jgi:pyridoxine 5-phosphate synthase
LSSPFYYHQLGTLALRIFDLQLFKPSYNIMTRLSVNINKVALIRNGRGGSVPNLLQVAKDCERFGADGITVHPRPDERHIRFKDVYELKEVVKSEFNVEGYPTEHFMQMMREIRPDQCTLVPDGPNVLTSSEGWDTLKHAHFLKDVVAQLQSFGIRVSLFVDTIEQFVEGAALTGADRIELYTGAYASNYALSPTKAVEKYTNAARFAKQLEIGVNAGHDLSLENLAYFKEHVPNLLEVSIGHALISDALYYGLENTIGMYRQRLGAFQD